MRLHLRLALAAICGSLVALLLAGLLGSHFQAERLQREVAALRLDERATLERGLLQRLADRVTAAAQTHSSDEAAHRRLRTLTREAAATATDLRLQASGRAALNLAAALDQLAAAALNADPAAASQLMAAEADFRLALATYDAEARQSAAVLQADGPGLAAAFILASLFAAGLALLALTYLMRCGLTRPLHHVGLALATIGDGSVIRLLPAQVPVEFAPLVAGYRQMTETLRRRQQDLDAQLRRTSLLTQLAIELRETHEPAVIVERVLRIVGGNLGLSEATLILTAPGNAPEAAYLWHGGSVRRLPDGQTQRRLQHGVEGWVQRAGSSSVIADVGASKRWLAGSDNHLGSAMILPVRQGAATLGILTVYAARPDAFTNHDLLLAEAVAAQTGAALGAALRYQEERERGRQAMALLAVSQMLTVERTRDELALSIDELSRSVFQADCGLLYLAKPGEPLMLIRPQVGVRVAAVFANAEDAAVAARLSGQIVTVGARPGQELHTCLALPLVHAGQTHGACVFIRTGATAAALPPSLWSLLTVSTNIIASACANIELVEQLRRYAGQLEALAELHTQELRRSRDLLRIIFDNLPEGLMLLDADGTLLAANNAFCRGIIGRIPREIVGHDYRQLWADIAEHPELKLAPHGPLESSVPLVPPAGQAFHRKPASWRVLGTDLVGQQRWYAVDRIPVVGLRGELDQYLERWSDITHQEELQRRLLLTEQLTTLGRLAASVAHEVGNPLQSAMGCLELCREDSALSALSREYLDLALGELDRMRRTMDSLRNLYRPPQIGWERVELNRVLREVARFTERQLGQTSVRMELDFDEALPPIVGQPDALRQVFLNLVLNAQQAMPQGGTIRISTTRKDTDRVCQVVVQDTGLGMSPEQQDHLFEPFRSGKAQGVGLGLYMSKQIIVQHTGHIEVASRLGHGTTITVLLPWSDAGPAGGRIPEPWAEDT